MTGSALTVVLGAPGVADHRVVDPVTVVVGRYCAETETMKLLRKTTERGKGLRKNSCIVRAAVSRVADTES